MMKYLKKLLSIPSFYHYSRQILLLGLPLKKWAEYGNYYQPGERIADLGCGPSDILRYVDRNKLPGFYLGIDISSRYLVQAELKAKKLNLNYKFVHLDLSRLSTDQDIRSRLIGILNEYQISTVNLFGVIHHIDDRSVITTLNTVYVAETVRSLNTQDVLVMDNNPINNFYASLDRGEYIRNEDQYDALIKKTNWPKADKQWSRAGIKQVKYIHYRLSK